MKYFQSIFIALYLRHEAQEVVTLVNPLSYPLTPDCSGHNKQESRSRVELFSCLAVCFNLRKMYACYDMYSAQRKELWNNKHIYAELILLRCLGSNYDLIFESG